MTSTRDSRSLTPILGGPIFAAAAAVAAAFVLLLAGSAPAEAFQPVHLQKQLFIPSWPTYTYPSSSGSWHPRSVLEVRPRQSKLRQHAAATRRCESVREKVANITAALVPDIPLQEDPLIATPSSGLLANFAAHFRPRFVTREFFIGARYMCHVLPLLMAGSIFGHMSLCFISLVTTSSGVIDLATLQIRKVEFCGSSEFHALDLRIKMILGKLLLLLSGVPEHLRKKENAIGLLEESPVMTFFIGPIAEELSYRGAAQHLAKQFVLYQSLFRANMLRGFGVTLTVAIEGLILLSIIIEAMLLIVGRKPAPGAEPLCHLFSIIKSAIALVPFFAMMKYLTFDSATIEAAGSDEKTDQIKESVVWRRTRKALQTARCGLGRQPGNSTLYYELQGSIEKTASRHGRWLGASMFGAAHGKGGPLSLQKIFGTIVSSLLVESRLVANRRTLWGAFGAHIMYNVSSSSLVVILFLLKTSAMYAEPKFWLLVLALFPVHVNIIRFTTRGLTMIEKKL
mmetsp:Transcript_27054/g.78046  ORF Transcript_27054/g.78046 Transcript_27054/m.78046 type:complete len:511 (+) Transcript_27054:159-1691(+)